MHIVAGPSKSGGDVSITLFTPGVTTTLLLPVMPKFRAPALGLIPLMVLTRGGMHVSFKMLLHTVDVVKISGIAANVMEFPPTLGVISILAPGIKSMFFVMAS